MLPRSCFLQAASFFVLQIIHYLIEFWFRWYALKKKKGKIREKLGTVFELPPEAVSGATRIIMLNNNDLFLENHKGIKEYTLTRVRIHTQRQEIIVKGKDMELKNMGAENLVITGEIASIEFEA